METNTLNEGQIKSMSKDVTTAKSSFMGKRIIASMTDGRLISGVVVNIIASADPYLPISKDPVNNITVAPVGLILNDGQEVLFDKCYRIKLND